MKPVIGIPMNIMAQPSPEFAAPIHYSPYGFAQGVMDGGATPMLFPLSEKEMAREYVDRVDAVLLAGGQDIAPQRYGEEPSEKITKVSHRRDAFELEIIKEAWQQNKPILGVCRGLQLMNVAFGGNLYQDISYMENAYVQHIQQSELHVSTHTIKTKEDSWIHRVVGEEHLVNSFHHQALRNVAQPFTVTAWTNDNVIEAIESKDPDRFAVGIQWHPELQIAHENYAQTIFNRFIEDIANFNAKKNEA